MAFDPTKEYTREDNWLKSILRDAYRFEHEGKPEKAIKLLDRVLEIRPFADLMSNRVFLLDFVAGASVERQQQARRDWWEKVGKKQPRCNPARDMTPGRKLVLGYVSADFRHHSAATSFGPVIASHDRDTFWVHCYHNERVQDETTHWFRKHAVFADISRMSDEAVCKQIEADKVDILVDLSGHTQGNRLGVFARKPAPIQVTAWGHVTGTGLPTIDYMFADPIILPERLRAAFAEKIWDLPCGVISEPPPLPVVDPPVLRNGYVTFGYFNRMTKLTDNCIPVWSRILAALPTSKILIKTGGFEEAKNRSRVRALFSRHGISPSRIDFMGSTKTPEHLSAAQEHVDVMLDPWPQNGGVSTWEFLYCGIPVVTMRGDTPPGLIGASIMSSIDLYWWIAETEDDYVQIATDLSSPPEILRVYRHKLAEWISKTPAGNIKQYTRFVDDAYRSMWATYCEQRKEVA